MHHRALADHTVSRELSRHESDAVCYSLRPGFLTARMAGINFWILLAYLSISVFVGLNPQQPVDSQTIIDSFIGLMVGMFIGALVSRIDLAGFAPRTAPDDLPGFFAVAATGRSASGKS